MPKWFFHFGPVWLSHGGRTRPRLMAPSTPPDGTYQLQFGPSPPLRKFIRPSLGMKAICVPGAGADGRLVRAPTNREYRRRRAVCLCLLRQREIGNVRILQCCVWIVVVCVVFYFYGDQEGENNAKNRKLRDVLQIEDLLAVPQFCMG